MAEIMTSDEDYLDYCTMFMHWARRKEKTLFSTERLLITTRYRESDEYYDIRHGYTNDEIGSIHKWGGVTRDGIDYTQYGYSIISAEQNKGYMTEALQGLVRHRKGLKLPIRNLFICNNNIPSQACARKAGWVKTNVIFAESVWVHPLNGKLPHKVVP